MKCKSLYLVILVCILSLGLSLGTHPAFAGLSPVAKAIESSAATSHVDYQSVQAEGGKNLRYRKLDNGYLLVLVPGQEIVQSLTAFQKGMGLKFATVMGLGSVENARISHFNSKTKKMDVAPPIAGSNEISSLICSLSWRADANGQKSPMAHCHINVGVAAEANRVVGGHLVSATVSIVGELFITTTSQEVLKTHDPLFDGDLFDLTSLDVMPITR